MKVLQSGINKMELRCRYLLFQSRQWKRKNDAWNLYKISNQDTRMTSLTSF